MECLEAKVAIITAAGSGMAKASAAVVVRESAQVVAADTNGAERDTPWDVGANVLPVHCDVTRESPVGGLNASNVGRASSCPSKAGVSAVTKAGTVECGPKNIRVNAICPGFIRTGIMGATGAEYFPELVQKPELNGAGKSAAAGQRRSPDRP